MNEITTKMGNDYLAACTKTRPLKGNKEISLAPLIMEYAIPRE